MHRCVTSTVFWLLPCIVLYTLVCMAAVELTPLKRDILGPSERLIVLRKIDNWYNSKKSPRTDAEKSIVFISSSLGIAAGNLADYKMYGKPSPDSPSTMDYSQFRCLDDQIAETSGQRTKTANFSNSAALISEDLLVAKEAVRLQGKPSLIILAIAPRDFLDHYTAAYHRSRLAQILLIRQAGPSWEMKKSIQENLDKLLCKAWTYYSQRVEFRDLAVAKACELFNRSATLFSAIESKATNESPKAPPERTDEPSSQETPSLTPLILKDNVLPEQILVKFDNDYRGRYLPIDTDRWKLEMDSLSQFTQFCRENQIPLLVVAMPITERNRNLLPKDFLTKHMNLVNEKTKKTSTKFLNLMADHRFTSDDFSDTVHLRSTGAVKLTKIITDEIQQQHLLP